MSKASDKKRRFLINNSQLLVPLIAILLLVIFNLIRDPSFFSVGLAPITTATPCCRAT